MFVRSYKARLRFGPPDTIRVYRCRRCGAEQRVVQNWHGPAPVGGFSCECGDVIRF